MLHQKRTPAPGKTLLVLTAALLLAFSLPAPARAEDKKPDSSLGLIPADAAYYSAMLRNREQFDAVAKSKSWARITKLSFYQMAAFTLQQQYSNPEGRLAPLRGWIEQDENRDLLQTLRDAVSDEIFCYGAANWVTFVELYTQLNRAQQLGGVRQLVKDADDTKALEMAAPRSMLRVLARNPDKVKVPDFVLGFKIKDAKKAEAQIKRLESLLGVLVMMQPILEGRVKRVKVGSGDFLTLKLDGEMLPWDKISLKDIEEAAGEFEGVEKNLKRLTLTISLGVRDGFLLLSFGSGTDGLKQLGSEGARLTARPELKPLVRAASKRLTGISYSSKALRTKSEISREDIDSLSVLAGQALDAAGIPEAKRKPIEKDLADLARDLKKNVPSVGASLAFSFLSERGYESFDYNHGDFPERDASKPLTLLEHVGGDPILAVVGRSKGTVESYQTMSKWIKIAYGHAEPLVVEKLDDKQKEKYQQVRTAFLPLVKRLDEVTSKMLLPALADGQGGFVLDAKWKSKQWQGAMPASDKALPMPELGILVGVSDSALLEKAVKSYAKILEDGIAKTREVAPEGEIPPVKMPEPEIKTSKAGKLFVFRLPKEWELDKQVAPTAGLSEKVGVLTLSAEHAERLLTRQPLKVEGGPLADTKRPLAGASYFSWSAVVDMLTPWVMFGLEQARAANALPGGGDEKQAEEIYKQVRTVLDVLKAFRVSTSATYLEEGVLVTHSETIVRDE
ncbi:MAG TPA: hypothetical protein VH575_31500 [Gemmataceae bacterium]|jgi:hypothetical protein